MENVAFGLADLAAYQGRADDMEAAIDAAESVRTRYDAVWSELHDQPELIPVTGRRSAPACGASTTWGSRWTSRWTRWAIGRGAPADDR